MNHERLVNCLASANVASIWSKVVPNVFPRLPDGGDDRDKILLYVEETIAFDDIVSAPSSTLFFQGKTQLSYKGDYEVLVYDNGTKSIKVSKNSFIIYDTSSERAFKLKFLSYDDWILRFKYSEL